MFKRAGNAMDAYAWIPLLYLIMVMYLTISPLALAKIHYF